MTVETRIRSNSQKAEEEAPSFAPVPGNPGSRPDLFYCTHVCVCLGLKARTYQARYVVLILRRGPSIRLAAQRLRSLRDRRPRQRGCPDPFTFVRVLSVAVAVVVAMAVAPPIAAVSSVERGFLLSSVVAPCASD